MEFKKGDLVQVRGREWIENFNKENPFVPYSIDIFKEYLGRTFKVRTRVVHLTYVTYSLEGTKDIRFPEGLLRNASSEWITSNLIGFYDAKGKLKEDTLLNLKPSSVLLEDKPIDFESKLKAVTDDITFFLLEKDKQYGSFYLDPSNTLKTNLTPIQRIKARLEEKLSRLNHGTDDENTLDDILGLLIHLKIAEKK